MNADIGYNGRVSNQQSVTKAAIHVNVNKLAALLGVEAVNVPTSDVEVQLSELNTWLKQLEVKLDGVVALAEEAGGRTAEVAEAK